MVWYYDLGGNDHKASNPSVLYKNREGKDSLT